MDINYEDLINELKTIKSEIETELNEKHITYECLFRIFIKFYKDNKELFLITAKKMLNHSKKKK